MKDFFSDKEFCQLGYAFVTFKTSLTCGKKYQIKPFKPKKTQDNINGKNLKNGLGIHLLSNGYLAKLVFYNPI